MDKEQLWSNFERKKTSKHYGVSGANFCKYYQRPPKTNFKTNDIIKNSDELNTFSLCPSHKNYAEMFQANSTQTDYRESETQTNPWDPPCNVIKVFKEPEALDLKDFYYGRGLPAGTLEVKYISKAREIKKLNLEAFSNESDSQFNKKKQAIWNQVKNDWNYRAAVLYRKNQEKLAFMQLNIVEDLKRHSKKKEHILKSLCGNKKVEMYQRHLQLEQKLQKELRILESSLPSHVNDYFEKSTSLKNKNKRNVTDGIDYVLTNCYLLNPSGTSTVKKWLEAEMNSLTSDILPSINKKVQKDKLAEKGCQYIFKKKKTKMPPKVFQEDYEEEPSMPPEANQEDYEEEPSMPPEANQEDYEEEPSMPTPKTEVVLEVLDVEEKKINLVTVWQQMLHGLACQKQMLELIERHKGGLSTILEPLYPGINNS